MNEPATIDHNNSTPLNTVQIDRILANVVRQIETTRWPSATYRVQFNSRCRFEAVTPFVAYLHELGISDLYSAPFLAARPGSPHGYDIVNHAEINPEIGTLDDLRKLRKELRQRDMGLIADVVPNHMAAAPVLNHWWQDVLENGPSSVFANYFDIDWMPLKPDLAHKVLLPVLGDQYGIVLEAGQLKVLYEEGAFWLTYFEHRFPIAPRTYGTILSFGYEEFEQRLGNEHRVVLELFSILTAIRHLPPRTETDEDRLAERRRMKEIIKRQLHDLVAGSTEVADFIAASLEHLNGQAAEARSFDRLDELLQDQAYRLSYWRVASDEINYRRFFDINDLAALCTESPPVFAEMHRLLFELLDDDLITGLRIDHPDGLYDPWRYFCQLQEAHFLRLCRRASSASHGPDSEKVEQRLLELWNELALIPGSQLARPLFVVVEKILAPDEGLQETWPVHGTVGYEVLNRINGVFVDAAGQRPLTAYYERFIGESIDFDELAYFCKRLIVRMSMASELNVLGDRLDRISERNRRTRDFTLSSITRALQEVVAHFSVYRTYVLPDRVLDHDVHYIERAVARAKRRNPAMSSLIFDFVRDVLLLRYQDRSNAEERQALANFTGKFQQLTGPIMAKAVEDTAFYRFNRLVALNEVGGEPQEFGTSVAHFHQFQQSRLPRLSHSLVGSSTHDTKRSEDVRARINVLSEVPKLWREKVQSWSRLHRRWKREVDGSEAPSRNAEYLFYQTLLGIWPDELPTGEQKAKLLTRMQQYMLKVEREAKQHTSWISPNEAYEHALLQFIEDVFTADRRRPFLTDLHEFATTIAEHGRWNSLSQTLLKMASPGVPDFYQGSETWTLTLVDPDNRQPVDFAALAARLQGLRVALSETVPGSSADTIWQLWSTLTEPPAAAAEFHRQLLETRRDGSIKLYLTWMTLQLRRQWPDLFTHGDYVPLETTGQFADCVIAFARRTSSSVAVIVVPRCTVRVAGWGGPPPLGPLWQDTRVLLPSDWSSPLSSDGVLRDLYTRKSWSSSDVPDDERQGLLVADLLSDYPFALGMSVMT